MRLADPVPHNPDERSFKRWYELEMRRRIMRLRAIYSIPDPDIRSRALSEDYWHCKENPSYWIQQYGWVVAPKEGEEHLRNVPFVFWNKQAELQERIEWSLHNGKPLLVPKGRELGISWQMLHNVYHGWRFSSMFSAKLGSRKESLVDDKTLDSLFGKLRYIHDKQPDHLKERNIKDVLLNFVNNRNNSEIIGEATNPGFGRGGRKTVIVFDEFAHVPPAIAAACWTAVDTVSKSIWLPSSVNGKGNKFYELFTSLPSECIFTIDWSANPYRGDKWKEEELTKLSKEEFGQEHECSFSAIRVGRIWSYSKGAAIFSESDADWIRIKEKARSSWYHVGGWDFGSGPSHTVCLLGMLEFHSNDPIPTLWIDEELIWQAAGSDQVINDSLARVESYSKSFRCHWGDPASVQRESDQQSWATKLQAAGLPFSQLPYDFNTKEGIDRCIKIVQKMLDLGKIKIHERCRGLIGAIDSWRYDIPDGVPLDLVSKAWIAPRKDVHSHPGNALMYLAGAVYTYMTRREQRPLKGLASASIGISGAAPLINTLRSARDV